LIFGLHPVNIECVAWITAVVDPLFAALLIPAYLCWVRSREASGRAGWWMIGSLSLYTLAMLTKETAVVLLLILFASQWLGFPRPLECPSGRWVRQFMQVFQALLPFFLLTAVYLLVRTVALRGFSHGAAQISWLTMIQTWPSLLLFYLKLLVWPVGLNPFYGLLYVTHPSLRNTVFPIMVLLLVAAGLWKWASRSRPVVLAIPWLIFPVFPVLDVQVFGNGNFAHNRYLYLPSIGFAMLLAAGMERIIFARPRFSGVRSAQIGLYAGLALILGLTIQVEDRYYASDATFYSYAYAQGGSNDPVIGMDYANTLAEQGDFSHAAEIYQRVIQAHPDMWNACFNLGYMQYQRGQLDTAVQYLSRASAGDPANPRAAFFLGLTDLKLHRLDEAEANLRRAIILAPATPNYHFALGMVMEVKGNWEGAMDEFSKELAVNPGNQAAAQQAAEIQKQIVKK